MEKHKVETIHISHAMHKSFMQHDNILGHKDDDMCVIGPHQGEGDPLEANMASLEQEASRGGHKHAMNSLMK